MVDLVKEQLKVAYGVTDPEGRLIAKTLRKKQSVAMRAALKEGESWALLRKWGYHLVRISQAGSCVVD